MQKRNSPLPQKRRRPIRKSIKPNRLQSLKNHQHHRPRKIGLLPQLPKRPLLRPLGNCYPSLLFCHSERSEESAFRLLLCALCALRALCVNLFSFFFPAESSRRKALRLERGHNRIRLRHSPPALQPPRRLRQPPPKPPTQKRPRRPNHHHPPPPAHQKMGRHQQSRKHRRHRHSTKSRHLCNRHILPARVTRHHFRHIGINHHNLSPNPHTRKKPQRNQPPRRRRKRIRKRKHRINQKQQNKRAPP